MVKLKQRKNEEENNRLNIIIHQELFIFKGGEQVAHKLTEVFGRGRINGAPDIWWDTSGRMQ